MIAPRAQKWLSFSAGPAQPDCSRAASGCPAWALATGATCEGPAGPGGWQAAEAWPGLGLRGQGLREAQGWQPGAALGFSAACHSGSVCLPAPSPAASVPGAFL